MQIVHLIEYGRLQQCNQIVVLKLVRFLHRVLSCVSPVECVGGLLLRHGHHTPIEVGIQAELKSTPADQHLLDAVDVMLDLITATSERRLTGTTLRYSLTFRHVP